MKKKLFKQSQWWKYAAGTVPIVCLVILAIIDLANWSHEHNQLLGFLLLCFFTVGILWWWWAVDKIVYLAKLLIKTEQQFAELKTELIKIKQEVKLLDSKENN